MPLKLWRLVVWLLVALLTGLAFAHVLESPAKLQYDAVLYLTLQKSLYVQWGPPHIGGMLEPLAIVATGSLVYFLRHSARGLWLSLAALIFLLLAFPVVYFVWVAPANASFLAATLTDIPTNWETVRADWEMGHAIRFVLQLSALVLLGLSLALGTSTREAGGKLA